MVVENEFSEENTNTNIETKHAQAKEPEKVFHRAISKIKNHIRSAFTNEGYIGDVDMALFRSAKYSVDEIDWIAEVKKASEKDKKRENKSNQYDKPKIYAYDLVKANAMITRDFYKGGHGYVSLQTDKYLDKILDFIEHSQKFWIQNGNRPGRSFFGYEDKMAKLSEDRKAALAKDKPTLLTMWLGMIHYGGDSHVLHAFGGYPPADAIGLEAAQYAQNRFLYLLSHLGEPPEAKKNILRINNIRKKIKIFFINLDLLIV